MNRIALLCCLYLFLCVGCNKEDDLTPSAKDKDRIVNLLDMSKPLVAEYYDKYGVAILTDFDDNIDLRFTLSTYWVQRSWAAVEINHVERETEIDSILNILENDILSCFYEGELDYMGLGKYFFHSDFAFREKYFPNKILLCNNLVSNFGFNTGTFLESVNRLSESGKGIMHCLENENGIIFNMNLKTMLASEENFQRFRKDMLYCLICSAMNKYDLHEKLPDEFFKASSDYYGRQLGEVLKEQGEPEEPIIRLEYLFNYSFICTSTYPGPNPGIMTNIYFPDKARDCRIFLDHLMTTETIEVALDESGSIVAHLPMWTVSKDLKRKMWYFGRTLLEWGIDVSKICDEPELLNLLVLSEDELNEMLGDDE